MNIRRICIMCNGKGILTSSMGAKYNYKGKYNYTCHDCCGQGTIPINEKTVKLSEGYNNLKINKL